MLDLNHIQLILSWQTKSGESVLENLTSLFIKISNSTLIDIRRAMKNKDHTEVIRLAHRLRSTSGNIGATYLTDLLSDFEMNYMKKDFKLRADMLNKIEAETKCICQKLLDIIGQQ